MLPNLLRLSYAASLQVTRSNNFKKFCLQSTEKSRILLIQRTQHSRGTRISRITQRSPGTFPRNSPKENASRNEQEEFSLEHGHQAPQIKKYIPQETLTPAHPASSILRNSVLVVARQIEMLNIFLGFEQANKYAIVNQDGNSVGYIAEEESFASTLLRQLFRTHRKFSAVIMNPEGEIVLRIYRPFAWINSRIFVSVDEGKLIGEVQQQWHMWRRRYNLFNKQKQFARIDAGFWAWSFDIEDENGGILGCVNRIFGGFAREIFTDTGQYVIEERSASLSLDERSVILAAAISIDFDYFSRHSGSGSSFHFPFLGSSENDDSMDGDDD
ncbi:12036_t:CDS:2 [Acaulospora morrowiae]|uniref:Phospholipid scramblase n=1 Tax=Acaulospora morrowiae TaxID=94023 RepID=A0A9N9CMB8_9GLOM|nr:12036_t:CDS:2 [Acaulospora morrowiae]